MQTIQQERAQFALSEVLKISESPSTKQKDREEYKAHASGLPAMIHINGLGQAAAFYKAKGGNYVKLYQLLSDWLTRENQPYSKHNDLLKGITEDDMHKYRLAQAEAQALMDWVKKFATAYMSTDTATQTSGN